MHETARDAHGPQHTPGAEGTPADPGEITESGQELIQRAPSG